jgi:hypothetical protein
MTVTKEQITAAADRCAEEIKGACLRFQETTGFSVFAVSVDRHLEPDGTWRYSATVSAVVRGVTE